MIWFLTIRIIHPSEIVIWYIGNARRFIDMWCEFDHDRIPMNFLSKDTDSNHGMDHTIIVSRYKKINFETYFLKIFFKRWTEKEKVKEKIEKFFIHFLIIFYRTRTK